MFSIDIKSSIVATDNISSNKVELTLPLVQLSGVSPAFHPSSLSATIAAQATKTFDLPGGLKARLIAMKASRPVKLVLIRTDLTEISLPRATFFQFLIDSKEAEAPDSITKVRVEVPAAAAVPPSPTPTGYPSANVVIFSAMQ